MNLTTTEHLIALDNDPSMIIPVLSILNQSAWMPAHNSITDPLPCTHGRNLGVSHSPFQGHEDVMRGFLAKRVARTLIVQTSAVPPCI